jgi:hypothetical protein
MFPQVYLLISALSPIPADHLIPTDALWYTALSLLIAATWVALLFRRLVITVQKYQFIRATYAGGGTARPPHVPPRMVFAASGKLVRLPSAAALKQAGWPS